VTVRRLATLGVLAVLVAGCGAATLYQPMTLDGGYTQTRLGASMFNVVFQGNAHTSWQIAENYALYRSAELSLESGFDYFVVVGGNSDVSRLLLAGREAYPSKTSGTDSHPMVSLIVRGFSGEKPSAQAFDARDVLKTLGPSIKRE
jgi:hypothetical protein